MTAAQRRVVDAARDLFAEHGVSATSLQMIADVLGVTKAAIYHQFPSKHEIVVACAEYELVALEAALDAAEKEPDRARAVDLLIEKSVELAVRRRHHVTRLQSDPVMLRVLYEDARFRSMMERYLGFVAGTDTAEGLVLAAMLSAAIGRSFTNPLVAEIDDETLRRAMIHVARRMVDGGQV